MNADPDALRRAADEMEAQSTRIGRLVADLRDRADKIHEVRLELGRAGFPVDEGAWPTDALRQLVDAHIALKAKPWSDAPITMALCSLLGDCRPAEIVNCVRGMKTNIDLFKAASRAHHTLIDNVHAALTAAGASLIADSLVERIGDLARRLEATELDRAGLVATTDTLRRERDGATRKLGLAGLYRAGIVEANNDLRRERDGALTQMDRLDKRLGLVASQLERAEAERDDLRATLTKCHSACNSAGIAIRADVSEHVHHMAGELASLRQRANVTKPTTPKWSGDHLPRGCDPWYWVYLAAAGWWAVSADYKVTGRGVDATSAHRLAELLAGFDPGGVWRVAGDPVTVAVVRAVCPTVAVSWAQT